MGRPINKRFFGNLAAPYDNAQTGGLTGQGGAGVASIVASGDNDNYTQIPVLTVAPPPVGTAATAQVGSMEVATVSVDTSGTGDWTSSYFAGQVLTLIGGAGSDRATVTVESVEMRTPLLDDPGENYQDGDTVEISGAGWVTPLVFTLVDDGAGSFNLAYTDRGEYNGPAFSNPVAVTTSSGTGTGMTINLGMGVKTVSLLAAGGYTTLPTTPVNTTVDTGDGVGAKIAIDGYSIKEVTVTSPGAGYVSAPVVTADPAGNATFDVTVGSGVSGALNVSANTKANGQANGGASADIMKQEASRRYLVRTGAGTRQCKLVAKATGDLAPGEMNLVATDHLGSTYYVTKLTSRRARISSAVDGGSGFIYGASATVGWTLGTPSVGFVQVASV